MFRRRFRLVQQARNASLCNLLGEFDRGEFRVRFQVFGRVLPDCRPPSQGPRAPALSPVEGLPSQARPARIVNQAGARGEILFPRPLTFPCADRLPRAMYAIRLVVGLWRGPCYIQARHLPSDHVPIACRQEIDDPKGSLDKAGRPDRPDAPPDPGIGVPAVNKASALSELRSATLRYCSTAP